MGTRVTSSGNGNGGGHGSGVDERTLAELVENIARLESTFAGWDPEQRAGVADYKRAIEALHAEALRRLVRACKSEPAALTALRTVAGDEVVYAVMRQLGLLKPSLDERVAVALESVRPMLASHGGDVELLRVAPPRVELRFLGACDGCASSGVTFRAGVEQAVRDACPEITEVVEVRGARGVALAATPDALHPDALHRDALHPDALHPDALHPPVNELVSPFALVARRSWRPEEPT